MEMIKSIKYNSPAILTFVFLSFGVLLLGYLTKDFSTKLCFSVYRSSPLSPFTYVRLFGHVLGHSGWDHYSGNMLMLLLVGPLLEEKYGTRNIIFIMVVTAFITGIINIVFFPNSALLGASGIVFAFILLSSITSGIGTDSIPLTLIIIAVIYIGGQIMDGLFIRDNIANLTHIIGGVIGFIFGYLLNVKA